MIKLLWFIPQPEQDIEDFESWYQDELVPAGMRQEFLQRFRISRSFYPQPDFVVQATGSNIPRSYRFSEGYWQNVEDIRRCYLSVHGRAALADGRLNMAPPSTPTAPSPVLVTEEEVFPVAEELSFNLREGRYRGSLACKLFGFVRLRDGATETFDNRYRALASKASTNRDLRGHVLGHVVHETVRLGRIMQWPPIGAEHFDRTLEFYFESRESLDQYCSSQWMAEVVGLVEECAAAKTWDAAQFQEVFYTSIGRQPLEESWKELYRS